MSANGAGTGETVPWQPRMPEIGLFPLELVLLPTERVPLHIFEPRYKELIQECLDLGTEFGLLFEDEEGRREVGTRAGVVEVLQVFEDGRMNVVVEGRERFRIVEQTEGRRFATADVEPLVDGDDLPSPEDVERAVAVFQRLAEAAEVEVDEPISESSPTLSFELAARVDFGLELRQEVLELTSERERLRKLAEIFERAVEAITVEREVRERAAGNGKVSPREG
jgi:Lon protease-like protein